MTKLTSTSPTVVELASQTGEQPELVAAFLNREAYRREYSSRPEVKEARKQYTNERNAKLAQVGKLLKLAQDVK